MLNFELWHVWIIFGIFLMIAEIFTLGFVLACFGVACIISGLVSLAGLGIKSQIGAFCIATLFLFFVIRPLFIKYFYSSASKIKTNVDALVNKVGTVSEQIDPAMNRGRVKVEGEDWRGQSFNESIIESGKKVIIIAVEGTKLVVRPVSKEREG